ncbi:MAG: DUF4132 domain-containing protein [Planctomycetota bacterium]
MARQTLPPLQPTNARDLAQSLFEQSLSTQRLAQLSWVTKLATDKPQDMMDAILRVLTEPETISFPRPEAIAEAESRGYYIKRSNMFPNGMEIMHGNDRIRTTTYNPLEQFVANADVQLLKIDVPWSGDRLTRLMDWSTKQNWGRYEIEIDPIVKIIDRHCIENGNRAPASMIGAVRSLRDDLQHHRSKKEWKIVERLDLYLGEVPDWPIDPRDAWAELALSEISKMPNDRQRVWHALLVHAASGNGDKPTKAWTKHAKPLLDAVGVDEFTKRATTWLPALALSREGGKPIVIQVKNGEALRGLAWFAAAIAEGDALPPALQLLAEAAHAKVPGIGRRCVQAGNGAIHALMQWPAEVAAGRLRAIADNVKHRQTTAYIEPRLDKIAADVGVSRDTLEEASLADHGFVDAVRSIELGSCNVTLHASEPRCTDVALRFRNDKGKLTKTAPAALRKKHAGELKTLKAEAKEVARLLGAVKRRLEAAPLEQRSWTLAEFRDRYLNHGLACRLARSLIWDVDGLAVMFDAKNIAHDVAGKTVKPKARSEVTLSHPIGRPMRDVVAWREQIEQQQITQPFKQAHREVYELTDAERETATYSNRFASHLIRQTQFRALAEQRGWKADYLGFWDNCGAVHPHRIIPSFGLRAEWWTDVANIENAPTTAYGGGAAILTTDQVRFYEITEREPMALDAVPPVVFSEVMRDVDLFVGVSSVGNDPEWLDHGTAEGYAGYWHSYSFGDLGATAQTRKAVLEKLVPRLKIRDVAEVTDKWLRVTGTKRTYKIHLGSGNILMEPNDQYLCIVPGGKADTGTDFLPFEGDRTLSIILSKALMLAADDKIKDRTILSQIGR